LARDHVDFTNANPQIPWASMRGMRNRIAHGYFEINLDADAAGRKVANSGLT
jgi:uncharacterized protein with HEPN domain